MSLETPPYTSLFDLIDEQGTWTENMWPAAMGTKQWLDTDWGIPMKKVFTTMIKEMREDEGVARTAALIWRPQQVLRGTIEYKIAHPEDERGVEAILSALDFITLTYQKGPDTKQADVKRARATLEDLIPELALQTIRQPQDSTTIKASRPALTKESTRLIERTVGNDLLLIPLANGGIPAGVDLYHRLTDRGADVDLYSVRMSWHKGGDEYPQLTGEEADLLREMAAGHQAVVLFDEDIYSGTSLERAGKTMKTLLPDTPIFLASNATRESGAFAFEIPDDDFKLYNSIYNQMD